MAFSLPLSDSVRKTGQIALMCGLCESSSKLKWKCLDCGLMMCQRCKDKVHPKFPSAGDHTIIDIKEFGKPEQDSESKPDLNNLKCEVHNENHCSFYCKTCQRLMCETCQDETHLTHESAEIKDEYEIKLQKLIHQQKIFQKEMHDLIISEQKLKQTKVAEQSHYDKVRQEILGYHQTLVNDINKYTKKLLKELDQKWKNVSNLIDAEMEHLKQDQQQIKKQEQEIKELLHENNTKNVLFITESSLKSRKINNEPFKNSVEGIPHFTPGHKAKISQILGKLNNVIIQINTIPEVKAQFETKLGCISTILASPDGGFWMGDRLSTIQKSNLSDDILEVVLSINIKICGAAMLPSGGLLVSVLGMPTIQLIQSDSTYIEDSVYKVSHLQATCVHVTGDQKVIVGAKEAGPTFPRSKPRMIIVMDKSGHQENVFEYDNSENPLFTLPCSIASDSGKMIAVVDMISDHFRGRVVVIHQEEGVRGIYTGHPCVNNEGHPFTPGGITTTQSDNFVVSDIYCHTLHILNKEGEIITFYNTKEFGILLPWSLSFCKTGQLYIGCGSYDDSEEKAKLFQVNNILC